MSREKDRALALACDRALVGLDADAERELASLMGRGAEWDPRLEIAAAAIALADVTIDEPLPAHLAERALASSALPVALPGARHGGTLPLSQSAPPPPVAPRAAHGGTMPLPGQIPGQSAPPPRMPEAVYEPASRPAPSSNVVSIAERRSRAAAAIPWLVAAACLAIAIGSWILRGKLPRDEVAIPTIPSTEPTTAPVVETAAAGRDRLIGEAKDLVRVAWNATKDPASRGESGEVVWSNARQEGYMTFRSLEPNDPKKAQYQLWIFDADRDERYPVDGGVFDVDAKTGEVVVPITARIHVNRPKLFAVTVEPPGGVVVSKRERIVAAAPVGS